MALDDYHYILPDYNILTQIWIQSSTSLENRVKIWQIGQNLSPAAKKNPSTISRERVEIQNEMPGAAYARVVTSSASLGSEALNHWSLVATTETRYFVFGFSRWMVKELPVAFVVAFVQFTPSVEYWTV